MSILNITFIGLYEEQNLGDKIIADCTEHLYFDELGNTEYNVKRLCLDYVEKRQKLSLKDKIINKINRTINVKRNRIDSIQKRKIEEYKKYYEINIKDSDIIIIVGGGLIKFTYQFFGGAIIALLETAYKNRIPVFFNSIGIEGYDEGNYKCQMLKKALNIPIIKSFTTRDDLKTLKEKYLNQKPPMPCNFVCDPAVWVSEIYKIKRNKFSDVIGIGIGRASLFVDNGIDFKKEQLFSLYYNLFKTLREKGYKVCLFTNGLSMDNDFAIKIKTKLKESENMVELYIPQSPQELVTIIASFRGMIATRLHSNIIAYSLDVPSVGLVWNDKLSFFGKNIGASEYYLTCDKFQTDTIINAMETAINNGYNQKLKEQFRNTIIQDIRQNVNFLLSNKL